MKRLLPYVALLLVVLGVLALLHPKLSFVRSRREAKLGPLEFAIAEREQVVVPPWVGIAAIAGGTALLFVKRAR